MWSSSLLSIGSTKPHLIIERATNSLPSNSSDENDYHYADDVHVDNPPDDITRNKVSIDLNEPAEAEESNDKQERTENSVSLPMTVVEPNEEVQSSLKRQRSRPLTGEDGKRPNWLPEGWEVERRVRKNGRSAGMVDKYYIEPTGRRHKFRSKPEVLEFLKTGKRMRSSRGRGTSSASPLGLKNSTGYRKLEAAANLQSVNITQVGSAQPRDQLSSGESSRNISRLTNIKSKAKEASPNTPEKRQDGHAES